TCLIKLAHGILTEIATPAARTRNDSVNDVIASVNRQPVRVLTDNVIASANARQSFDDTATRLIKLARGILTEIATPAARTRNDSVSDVVASANRQPVRVLTDNVIASAKRAAIF
ncbi:MAG: hypothetical protein AB8G18_01525, partial [Gammaproteobacteria bacterium]